MDDGLNVHGIYTTVESVVGNVITVKYNHMQHKDADLFSDGDELLIRINDTLKIMERVHVESVCVLNRDYALLTVSGNYESIKCGMLVDNVTKSPSVKVSGCTFEQNRARGILLAASGDILIENNCFHVPGAAILLESDSYYWYESGAIKNLVIRNNEFYDCAYRSEWGEAVISVVSPPVICDDFYLHENIVIEKNLFDNCPCAVNAVSVDGLGIKDNKFIGSDLKKIKGCTLK